MSDQKETSQQPKEGFINPIDPDKITENPSTLPYAHTVGSAVIRPIDKGRIKGTAMTSMYEQTESQLDQIREQVELLYTQAERIRERVRISEQIYHAEMSIVPVVGHTYHLYSKKNGTFVLSLIAPTEWGKSCPYTHEATVKLLGDHTWDVLR